MNYYNTSVILNSSARNALDKKDRTEKNIVIIPLKSRFATSEESARAQLIRELPEDINVDDVEFLISVIFE